MRAASGLAVLGVALLAGCGADGGGDPGPEEPSFPAVAQFTTLDLANLANYAAPAWPAYYDAFTRSADNAPAGNPVTDAGATLGRVLFHDVKLSRTDNRSCASCHLQDQGFTDPELLSIGIDDVSRTPKHSMRLANARFFRGGRMFWDRRTPSLEQQATLPVKDAIEMGFDEAHGGFAAVIAKLNGLPYYPELFRFVYGDAAITEERVQRALAQYVRSIVSFRSRFDDGFAAAYDPSLPDLGLGRPFANFTAEENRGKLLFLRNAEEGGAACARCHVPPTFALSVTTAGNGLDRDETTLFKAPSLKNVAVTGPYMHDGRFGDLAQVVEHYASGVQPGPQVDGVLLGPDGPRLAHLTAEDKAAIVAFLGTLTDTQLLSDPKFSSPFRPREGARLVRADAAPMHAFR